MVRVFIFFVRLSLQSNSCYTYSHPSDLLRLPAQSPRRRQVCRCFQRGALEVSESAPLWLLIILLTDTRGDYGHGGPKCGTTYHTVYTTVKDTFFEKSCTKVSDRQCKTVFDTSYEGEIETQCKPSYESKASSQSEWST